MTVCLVTGGAGFLGSHVAEALVKDNYSVRVADSFSTGSLTNLAEVLDRVELYPGDLRDPVFLARAMRGVELVFHFGGPSGSTLPVPGEASDAAGTWCVLSTALEARVRRVLLASSAEVYGLPRQAAAEEGDLAEPFTPAGRTALSSELACVLSTKISGLETVRLRYFNVYGPRQPSGSAYAAATRDALRAMSSGLAPLIEGDGSSEQDLLYVEDAAHAAVLAGRARRVAGKVYNVASGRGVSCRQVIDTLNRLLGSHAEPVYTGKRPPNALDNVANVRRAEVDLGFCAATDLYTGLARCLDATLRTARPATEKPATLRQPDSATGQGAHAARVRQQTARG